MDSLVKWHLVAAFKPFPIGVHSFAATKEMVCGLFAALSTRDRVPPPDPLFSNQSTVMVQARPGFRVVPQLFPLEKGPVMVIPVMSSA